MLWAEMTSSEIFMLLIHYCKDTAEGTVFIISDKGLVFVSVDGGAGNDSISSFSSWSTIGGGEGDDIITNYYADHVLMTGGAGSDSLNNYGEHVTIDGGDSNDTINNYSAWATLTGGNGDDSIRTNVQNTTILYSKYEGNDTFYIRADNNTIYLTDVSLDDIQSISNSSGWSSGSYSITFTSSNVLKVDWQSSFNNYDHTVKFSDGKDYTYDKSRKSFVEK